MQAIVPYPPGTACKAVQLLLLLLGWVEPVFVGFLHKHGKYCFPCGALKSNYSRYFYRPVRGDMKQPRLRLRYALHAPRLSVGSAPCYYASANWGAAVLSAFNDLMNVLNASPQREAEIKGKDSSDVSSGENGEGQQTDAG